MYHGKTLTLSIENPDEEGVTNQVERIRRLAFYECNGFQRLGIVTREFGVYFALLGTEQNVTRANYLSLMRDFLGRIGYRIIFFGENHT